MFFVLSKIFWVFANPVSLTIVLVTTGILLSLLRWRKLSFTALTLGVLVLAVASWTSAGALLMQPLESRFQRPERLEKPVDGIIVLGGALRGKINAARKGFELNNSADRMVEAAILAMRHPQARILVSGGGVFEGLEGDADAAPRMFEALGIEPHRLILEGDSRNTHENAVLSRELMQQRPGEVWLLVTSAFHMPRSVGLFRKAGLDVVPWPTDYRTTGRERFGLLGDNAYESLLNTSTGMREWIGLVAYWLTGRIDELFPAPRPAEGPRSVQEQQ